MALIVTFDTNGLITFSELANTTGSTLLHQHVRTSSLTDNNTPPGHFVSSTVRLPEPPVLSGLFQTHVATTGFADPGGSATGDVTYTFSVQDRFLDSLRQGEIRTQKFNVTISDGDGESVTQQIEVRVTGANDRPKANVDIRSISENISAYTYKVTGNDTDPDIGDHRKLTTASVFNVSSAAATFLDEAMVKITKVNFLNNALPAKDSIKVELSQAFQGLAAGENALIVIRYGIVDDFNATSASEFRLTIIGANDAQIIGTNAVDKFLFGEKDADTIRGLNGNDTIDARAGNDIVIGGLGKDIMKGGLGLDKFQYFSKLESGRGALADDILDFKRGQDKIDLSPMPGAFKFLGAGAFVAGQINQLRIDDNGAHVTVEIDTNGDRVAEMMIDVLSVGTLAKTDFIL